MWWFLVLLGVLITLSGVSVIALGVSIFISTFGNTLITTGAVAASGGLVIIAMGLVLRQMERLSQRIETAIARGRGGAPDVDEEMEDEPALAPQIPMDDAMEPAIEEAPPAEPVRTASREPQRRAPTLSVEDLLPPEATSVPPQEPQPRRAPPARPVEAPAADPMLDARRAHLARRGETPPRQTPEPALPPLPRTGYEPPPRTGEPKPAAPAVEAEQAPEEPRILKSGIVGGMAYTLYSDGSIQAELPDGVVRFASLQELRDHVARTQ